MSKKNIVKVNKFTLIEAICESTGYRWRHFDNSDIIIFTSDDGIHKYMSNNDAIIEGFMNADIASVMEAV